MKTIKDKKCKQCEKVFKPNNSLQRVCSIGCAKEYAKDKVAEKRIKSDLSLEKFKNELTNDKSLKASLINTKMQVHTYVRERDKYKPCISCNVEWNSDFQAGHFYKSETFTTLKFNLDNIQGQCRRCNMFLDGNFDNYALNLPKRIGIKKYNDLVALAQIDKQFQKVWNLDNLREIRLLIKQLK